MPEQPKRSQSTDKTWRDTDSAQDVEVGLLSSRADEHDEDELGTSLSDVLNAPKSPGQERPPFVRHFSVRSRTHEFDVINYGPQSVERAPKSVIKAPRTRHVSEPSSPASKITEVTTLESVIDIPEEIEQENNTFPQKKLKSVRLLVDEQELDRKNLTDFESMPVCRSFEKPANLFDRGILDIAKRGRAFAKRKKDRLVNKNGECRIVYSKVKKRGVQFLIDFFTTMLELKWRYHFLMFCLAFGLSWLVFAVVWLAIVKVDQHLNYPEIAINGTADEYIPCVLGVTDFASALLFSIETQHTIGYGTRAITPSCPIATGILMIQSMYGVILQCILTGIIFAKMARPKRRAQTIIFSTKAVICNRDGQRCLMFRVGDMRKSQILGAKVQVMLVKRRVTKEGEYLPIVTQDLPVTTESGSEFIFLAWPIIIMHKIDEVSPIWELSASDLLEKDWELIVVLEGVDEITGSTFQVRTSYLPSEILWGQTLKSLLSKSAGGIYTIDYTYFHETDPINISDFSARRESRLYSTSQSINDSGVNTELSISSDETFLSNGKHTQLLPV